MNELVSYRSAILAALSAAGTVASHALGGWDGWLRLLVVLMVSDYFSGLLLAGLWHKSPKSAGGALESNAAFKGIVRKCLVFVLVMVGALADQALGADYMRTAVCIFFIGSEGISLLENVGLMGVPYPPFLEKALEALQENGGGGGSGT
jgi:toxin secretion/phage lysis holin